MLESINFSRLFLEKDKQKTKSLNRKSKANNFSFTYFQSKSLKNEKNLERLIEKPFQQQFYKNSFSKSQLKKKQFQKSQLSKTRYQKKTSFIIQRPLIYFNHIKVETNNKESASFLKKSPSEKENKEQNLSIKRNCKNIQQNNKSSISSTKLVKGKYLKNAINTNFDFSVEESTLRDNKNQLKNQQQLYYCDLLIKQIEKLDFEEKSIDDNKISALIKHFFQSISTFYRYKNIQIPEEPHINVFLPQIRKFNNLNTLIFDMDETLIHAQLYNQEKHNSKNDWGQNFDIMTSDGKSIKINLKIRPFAKEVLQRLKKKFQIGLFTAADQNYARQIITKIDPSGKLFDFCLFRQHCHIVDNKLSIKDLRILSNRSIKNIILIDNSPHTYLYQLEHAIPIVSFYEDQQETWMLQLQKFLINQNLHLKDDVRPFLKSTFQFHKYCQFNDVGQMVETLYKK